MSEFKNIIIIDDEKVINDAVKRICAENNLNVDAFENATAALKKLRKKNYALILCDIMLPGMDGFQFLEELNKLNIQVPVIMITGYSTIEFTMKSFVKGAIDFIPKPFSYDELMSAIIRGIEFTKIKSKLSFENKDSIVYVESPSRYFRLSYISWAYINTEGFVSVGVTDLFLKTIRSFKSIKLNAIASNVNQGFPFCEIESSDGIIHRALAPLTGKILERNEKLLTEPTLIEKDPYFEGWIYRIVPEAIDFELKYLIKGGVERF